MGVFESKPENQPILPPRHRSSKSYRPGEVVPQPARRKSASSGKTTALPFERRLAVAGLPELIYKYRDPRDVVVNLATLQRINILGIQEELIREVARIDDRQEVPANQRQSIKRLLSDYGTLFGRDRRCKLTR
jgi:hypothetical protein